MKALFIEYPKCSTCQKAKKYLQEHNIDFEDRNIVEENPTVEELKQWIKTSNKDINKFFNTSGILYRQMELSKKINDMSEDEKINILASNGMLVKRPLLILDNNVLIGFKIKEWDEI
jgi:arsenate reductase